LERVNWTRIFFNKAGLGKPFKIELFLISIVKY
jgi:hypothetical protein